MAKALLTPTRQLRLKTPLNCEGRAKPGLVILTTLGMPPQG